MSVERQWIKYVAVSVLLHAAILSIPLHTEKTGRTDPIAVVVVDESAFALKSGQQGGSPGRPGREGTLPKTIHPKPTVSSGSKASPVMAKDESPPTPVEGVSRDESPTRNEGQRTTKASEGGVATAARGLASSGGGDGSSHGDALGGNGRGAGAGGGAGGGYGSGVGEAGFNSPSGPRFLRRETPEYPLMARRRKKEGQVVLIVTIDERGRLANVEVAEASDRLFVEPSIEAVKKSTFLPAMRNGAPIAVRATLPIRFSLKDS